MKHILKRILWNERKLDVVFIFVILSIIPKIYPYLGNQRERVLCLFFLIIVLLFCLGHYASYLYRLKHTEQSNPKEKIKMALSLIILFSMILFVASLSIKGTTFLISQLKHKQAFLTDILPVIENIILFPVYSNLAIAVFYSGGIFSKEYFVTTGKLIKHSYLSIVTTGGILELLQLLTNQTNTISFFIMIQSCISSIVLWGIVLLYAEKNFRIGEWIYEIRGKYQKKKNC